MSVIEDDFFIFEWDARKSASNLVKHGIAFQDVLPVFYDPATLTKQHKIVDGEMRWKTLGKINGTIVLFIGHLYLDNEDKEVVRIITARQATKAEQREYYDNR